MADIAADKAVIREIVENWVLWRERGYGTASAPSGTPTAG